MNLDGLQLVNNIGGITEPHGFSFFSVEKICPISFLFTSLKIQEIIKNLAMHYLKKMKPNSYSFYAILYVIAWIVSPPLSYGMLFRVIAMISIIILYIDSLKYANAYQQKNQLIVLGLSAYMIGVAVILEEDFNIKVGTIVLLLTGVLFDIWVSNNKVSKKQLQFLLFYTLLLYCVWNSTTLYSVLFENERIMRDLTRNSEFSEYFALRGIGGFGYIYSVILMLPVAVELLRFKKMGKTFRILNIYFVLTGFMLAYFSEYFIAMILAILTLLLVWKKPGKSTFILLGIIVVIFGMAMETILDIMIELVDIPEINHKLIEMRNILISDADVEDSEFGVRYERYVRDIGFIIDNPIWGTLSFKDVGKHSEFLDFFAQYGVPLGIIYVSALLRPAIIWIKRNVSIASVVLFFSVIMCILNRLPLHTAVPLCFFMPTFCQISIYHSKR